MKHSYRLMIVVSVVTLMSSVRAVDTVAEELKTAVNDADLQKVKESLRKLDRQQLPDQDKKKILSEVLGFTDESLEQHKSAGFLNDRVDLVRCVGGALIGVVALSYLAHNVHQLWKGACDDVRRLSVSIVAHVLRVTRDLTEVTCSVVLHSRAT